MMSASVELGEAVPLLGAYACRLAEELSMRALLIKGAPATALGMRADRPSIDVDLWVDPAEFSRYQSLLLERGWQVKPGRPEDVGWGHAVTLVSDGWPCTIDLHRRFPGFLTDDGTAFELAWHGRTCVQVGHVDVAVPGRVVAAAITVLHAERSPNISETAADQTTALAAAGTFTVAERADLEHLVTATSSEELLGRLLTAAGASVAVGSTESRRLDDWRLRLHADTRPGGVWIVALRQASWRRKPALLAAAATPTDMDYAAVGADRTWRGCVRATSYRWRRLARVRRNAS